MNISVAMSSRKKRKVEPKQTLQKCTPPTDALDGPSPSSLPKNMVAPKLHPGSLRYVRSMQKYIACIFERACFADPCPQRTTRSSCSCSLYILGCAGVDFYQSIIDPLIRSAFDNRTEADIKSYYLETRYASCLSEAPCSTTRLRLTSGSEDARVAKVAAWDGDVKAV